MGSLPSAQRKLHARRLWLELHRYVGLVAGAVFVLIGLTGSLMVFSENIDAWLNPGLYALRAGNDASHKTRPLNELVATVHSSIPTNATLGYVDFPRHGHGAMKFYYSVPTAQTNVGETWQVFLNPQSGESIGTRLESRDGDPLAGPFMNVVTRLHYTLCLGTFGANTVATLSLFLMVSVLSGLMLWWPPTGKLRHALSFKWNASRQRRVYDLHRQSGFWFSVVLILLLFSGIYMIWPKPFEKTVSVLSPVKGWPENLKSAPAAGRTAITPADALANSEKLFADGYLMGIGLPTAPEDVYCVRRHAPGEVTQCYTHRQVYLDQYTGKVLAVTDPRRYSAGEKFLEWQYPLHSGEAFGLPGRWVIFASGFVPLILYTTGMMRWLQKRHS